VTKSGSASRDVEVPIDLGSLAFTLTYGGDPLDYATTGCGSFNFEVRNTATGQTYFTSSNCGIFAQVGSPTATTRDLPVGSYQIHITLGSSVPMPNSPPPIDVASAIVNVTAGVPTAYVADVTSLVGQLRGVVLLNGLPPTTSNYNVNATNDANPLFTGFSAVQPAVVPPAPAPRAAPGSFRLLMPPGATTGVVTGDLGARLATFHATITAGQAADVGSVEAGTGSLGITLTYRGDALDYATTGCGGFSFELKSVATNQGYFVNTNCGVSAQQGAPVATARDLPGGDYQLRIFMGSSTPMPMGPQPLLLTSQTVSIQSGPITPFSFEVGDQVGQVTGVVTINGASPTTGNYSVTVTNDANSMIQSFATVQPNSQFPPPRMPPGSFRLLVAPGAATGVVHGDLGAQLSTFHTSVNAGQTSDVGTIEAGTGSVAITLTYQEIPLDYAITGCGPFSFEVKNVATNQTYFTNTNCGLFAQTGQPTATARDLPPGNYQIRVVLGSTVPMSSGPQPVILASEVIAVAGGAPTPFMLDVSDVVGQVRGTVLINGQPPTTSNYNVTITNDANPTIQGFGTVQPTTTFPPPRATPGSFRILMPGGPATGKVFGDLGSLLATFHINVVANTVIDIGNPVDPPPTAAAGGPYTGSEGQSVTLAGTSSATDARFTWDFGDGSPAATGANVSHVYADNGTFTATLTATANGKSATSTAVVTVANVAPIATFAPIENVLEGAGFTLHLNNPVDSPADLAGLQYAFDCGTGYGSWTSSPTASCFTTDNEARRVNARVRDKDGGSSEYSQTVNILNVAPVVSMPASGPVLLAGETYQATGLFSDPGTDSFDATVSYEGTAAPLALTGNSFSLDHLFTSPGTFTIRVSVRDDDGGVGSASTTVVVESVGDALGELIEMVRNEFGKDATPLNSTLEAAVHSVDAGNRTAARNQIDAFLSKLSSQRGLDPADVAGVRAKAERILRVM
jgi:PKD repeat protein